MADRIRPIFRGDAGIGPLPLGTLPADYPETTDSERDIRASGPGGSGFLSPDGVRFMLWLDKMRGDLGSRSGAPTPPERSSEDLMEARAPMMMYPSHQRTMEGPTLELPGEAPPASVTRIPPLDLRRLPPPRGRMQPGLDLRTGTPEPPAMDRRTGLPVDPGPNFTNIDDLILLTAAQRQAGGAPPSPLASAADRRARYRSGL